jgi:hypothetical protein
MAINWGTLQGIAPPHVSGSIPASPDNRLNSLAGGIMSGILQGQQMQGNALQMKATQQAMDQQAALFPGQQQIQQQAIETGDMAIQAAKQGQLDGATVRAGAQKGEQSYLNALQQTGNMAGIQDYLKAKADVQSSLTQSTANLAAAKSSDAATQKIVVENQSKILQQKAAIYSMAAQIGGSDPKAVEDAYQKGKEQLPSEISKMMPAHYDQSYDLATHTLANMDLANIADQENAKQPKTDLEKAQNLTEKATNEYQNALKTGDTTKIKRAYEKYTQSKENEANTVKKPGAEATSPVQKTVEYITDLKSQVSKAKPGSPEAKLAQDELDFALEMASKDKGIWSQIKSKVADVVGGSVGGVVNAATSSPITNQQQPPQAPVFSPQQIQQELARRQAAGK